MENMKKQNKIIIHNKNIHIYKTVWPHPYIVRNTVYCAFIVLSIFCTRYIVLYTLYPVHSLISKYEH